MCLPIKDFKNDREMASDLEVLLRAHFGLGEPNCLARDNPDDRLYQSSEFCPLLRNLFVINYKNSKND